MNIKKILNSFMKSISILSVFAIMYFTFSMGYPALRRPSRTLIVFIMAFFTSFTLFSNIFGTFQFGQIKSKPITYTTSLAVFFTDVFSYLSILVMSTNPNNPQANQKFVIEHFQLLLLTFIAQLILIYVISYVGNNIYFHFFKPKRTVLVTGDGEYRKYTNYLYRFAKQYTLVGTYHIEDPLAFDAIFQSDLVIITDVELGQRKILTDKLYLNNIDFIYTATVTDMILLNGHTTIYDDIPVVEVNTSKVTFEQRIAKRLMDISISTLAIIFSSPIWILIIVGIKLTDGGPIFFTQDRKTINGKVFKVVKFRTMKVGSENYSATENDTRITPVGRVIRKVRMDELPQFLNILMGDMSVVGPRPEMLENINEYENMLPEFKYRLKMKAGLTGLAQIEGKYNTNPKEKLIMDLSYIENYSIWLDVKLIFRTLIVFFKKDSVDGFED